MNAASPAVLVFIGGGPRTVSLLERLSANAAELLPAAGMAIHVVDPYPAGGVGSGGGTSRRCFG